MIVKVVIGQVRYSGSGGGVVVVDNLTTQSASSALSAKQGFVLKGLIDNIPEADGNADTLNNQLPAFYLDRSNHTGNTPVASIPQDSTHRFVSDADKTTWNAKQDALGFTPVNTTDPRLTDARAPTAHQHAMTDVTGLAAALAGKANGTDVSTSLSGKVDKVTGQGLSSNDFTTAEKDKLASLEGSKFQGTYSSLSALNAADVGGVGHYAYVDEGVGIDISAYIWDENDSQWVIQKGTSTAETPATIKTKYESNPDTNAFTDTEKTKLGGLSNYDDTAVNASIASLGTTKADKDSVYTKTESNTALAAKAPLTSPAFTGTVTGVTKAMVGLSAVENTSDAAKPISTATQLALDDKANTVDLATVATTGAYGDLSGKPTIHNIQFFQQADEPTGGTYFAGDVWLQP